jgi:hypothetical protein
MRSASMVLLAVAIAATLAAGCDRDAEPTAPPASPRLSMEVTADPASARVGEVVTITATLTNHGPGTVEYDAGCVSPRIDVRIDDPEHRGVSSRCDACPQRPCPACVDVPILLRPGETISVQHVFDGRVIECEGSFEGLSGLYHAEATFTGRVPSTGAGLRLVERAPFDWTAANP